MIDVEVPLFLSALGLKNINNMAAAIMIVAFVIVLYILVEVLTTHFENLYLRRSRKKLNVGILVISVLVIILQLLYIGIKTNLNF